LQAGVETARLLRAYAEGLLPIDWPASADA
jgi:hypothetical protein